MDLITSSLPEETPATTENMHVPAQPRKRRFFEFLYDDENGRGMSPPFTAIPREKIRKSLEALHDYRGWLHWKESRVQDNLQTDRRLKLKDELIRNLKKRVMEYESKFGVFPCEESKPTDHNLNKTQDSLAVKNLLTQIDRLQEENDNLENEIKIVKQKERCWANKYWELYESCSEKNKKISRTEFECAEKEKRIKSLVEEKQILSREKEHFEQVRSKLEEEFRQQIHNILQQKNDAEKEMLHDKIEHLEFMANYKPMVIIENPQKCAIDESILDAVNIQMGDIKADFLHLRKKVADIPDTTQNLILSTTLQIQRAVQETSDKYNELFPKYKREIELRKKYHNELVELRGNIRVFCRVRPVRPNSSEEMSDVGDVNEAPCVSIDPFDDSTVKVNSKGRCQDFQFDKVFMENTTQSQVFHEVSSLVTSVLDGFNVCIFAYGQTGSGKTYTMEGPLDDPGINQRALKLLFEKAQGSGCHFSMEASVLEIYNETVRDLLNSDTSVKLEVKINPEGGFHVPGLVQFPVTSLEEANQIFSLGRRNRATGATNMNEHSSRSHCLLCVSVTGVNTLTGVKTHARLNLVDLAGSERVSKSLAEGSRLKEAQNINKSLSSLGDVINALKNKQNHVPYRNSKLTYLLQGSLSGDSKTLMILQVSPEDRDASETVCTMGFGQRVSMIELGAASKRGEEGGGNGKGTPSSLRRGVDSAMKTTPTIGGRTPNLTKGSALWSSSKAK